MQRISYHNDMRLADVIAQERKRRGWSRQQLAAKAHVSPATISRLESGDRFGRTKTIADVTSALGIDPVTVGRIVRQQEAEDQETQYVDLSKIPAERRPMAKRMIDAILRQMEERE